MAIEDMDDLHLRIARVTEDLRTIQQELNCAAMQAPSDPELMEALNSLSETEPIETLRSALDQMRFAEIFGAPDKFGNHLLARRAESHRSKRHVAWRLTQTAPTRVAGKIFE